MERISNGLIISRDTILYFFSMIFERASFYGFRALLVLYISDETIFLDTQINQGIYKWFIISLIFIPLFGGFISDIRIGNRNGIIAGGILQALGALFISFPYSSTFYIGLVLYLIGEGFYSPNILAQYGKGFYRRSKVVDVGFLLLSFPVIFGSTIGTWTISYIGDHHSISFSYLIIAFLSLGSLIFIVFVKSNVIAPINTSSLNYKLRLALIGLVTVTVGVYWCINKIGYYNITNLFLTIQNTKLVFPLSSLDVFYLGTGLLVIFLVLVVWSNFYYSLIKKMIIGFSVTTIGFGMLIMVIKTDYLNFTVIMSTIVLLYFGEVHISPMIYSIATKYSNPKHLATILSLSLILIRGCIYISGIIVNSSFDPDTTLLFIMVISACFAALILLFMKSKLGKSIGIAVKYDSLLQRLK